MRARVVRRLNPGQNRCHRGPTLSRGPLFLLAADQSATLWPAACSPSKAHPEVPKQGSRSSKRLQPPAKADLVQRQEDGACNEVHSEQSGCFHPGPKQAVP